MKKIAVLAVLVAAHSALCAITVTVATDPKKNQVTTTVAQKLAQPGTLGTHWGG